MPSKSGKSPSDGAANDRRGGRAGTPEDRRPPPSLHLPFLILAIAFAIMLGALAFVLVHQRESLAEEKRRLEEISLLRDAESRRLARDATLRETQLKRLADAQATREMQFQQLADAHARGVSTIKQLADTHAQREVAVKQFSDLQAKFQDLILDLLLLGKTDDDARGLIEKYHIQQQPAAGAVISNQ